MAHNYTLPRRGDTVCGTILAGGGFGVLTGRGGRVLQCSFDLSIRGAQFSRHSRPNNGNDHPKPIIFISASLHLLTELSF